MAENREQFWEFETDVPPAEEIYSLEDILAEYGEPDQDTGRSGDTGRDRDGGQGEAEADKRNRGGRGKGRSGGRGIRNPLGTLFSGVGNLFRLPRGAGRATAPEAVSTADAEPEPVPVQTVGGGPEAVSIEKADGGLKSVPFGKADGERNPVSLEEADDDTESVSLEEADDDTESVPFEDADTLPEPVPIRRKDAAPESAPSEKAGAEPEPVPAAGAAGKRDAQETVEEILSAIGAEAGETGAKKKAGTSRFRSVNISALIGKTVDAAISERRAKAGQQRTLFSRRTLWDTRDLHDGLDGTERAGDIVPEPPLGGAAAEFRAEYERRIRTLIPVGAAALLPLLLLLLERYGVSIPLWSTSATGRNVFLLLCLGVTIWLCRKVFTGSAGVFLCGAAAMASLCDCVFCIFSASRSHADSYAAVSCLALAAAQWGMCLESRAMYDTFRAAAVDSEPPYLLTDTEEGACKQRGSVPGFYTTAMGGNISSMWMTLLLPLLLVASVVFATLSSVGQDRNADFFLNWSAILTAGATLSLPLCWGLPWAHLARKLHGAGCAVAGWNGAEHLSRRKGIILTDSDLFPPGSIVLNGVKLYGDGMAGAVSCAASMTRAAACGLERVFDELLRSEMGKHLPVEEFSFYEEGGYSGIIQGQNVLLGTRSFLRRMGIPLPRDVRVSTGMFLAVNRRLAAVFSMKYKASENVDFALHMLRSNRIVPILASRDPNITPALLRRKFRRTIKMAYPPLAERVALSEAEFDQDIPRALLFREGLLPYAEAVVGSHRLCRAVRRSTLLGLFGSMAGMLLTFYLVFQGKYDLLSPLTLLLFLLLWLVPSLLLMDLV